MRIINDNMRLVDFDAWSGAIDTKETIIDAGKGEAFDRIIEDLYPDGLTDVDLNDLLWHDSDWCLAQVGISTDEEE